MSAIIIPLPSAHGATDAPVHHVGPDSLIFMGQLLIAMGESMAGRPSQSLDPMQIVDGALIRWKEIVQQPVKG